jgi:hypothetical protein
LQGRNIAYQWLKNNAPIPAATLPDYVVNTPGTYKLKVTNILNFSDTSDAFVFGALPVSLVNFNAQRQSENTVRLQWQTSSEHNSSGFILQRRTAAATGFSNIAWLPSKAVNGNADASLSYNYIDSNAPSNQNLFYRLQVNDRDGSIFYSDIRIINSDNQETSFTIYPNPATGQTIISLNTFTGVKQLTIFDLSGKRISVQQLTSSTNMIRLNGLKGIYILQLSGNNGENIQRRKLIVL